MKHPKLNFDDCHELLNNAMLEYEEASKAARMQRCKEKKWAAG